MNDCQRYDQCVLSPTCPDYDECAYELEARTRTDWDSMEEQNEGNR